MVEGFNAANQLDAVHQKDGDRGVFFSQGVKKYILKVLSFVHNELNGGYSRGAIIAQRLYWTWESYLFHLCWPVGFGA